MMKKFVIFGAGDVGKSVWETIGEEFILCFCDNHKRGEYCGFEIISFPRLIEIQQNVTVILASFDYIDVMEEQLRSNGICNYFIWPRRCNEMVRAWYLDKHGEVKIYHFICSLTNHAYDDYQSIAVYCYKEWRDVFFEMIRGYGIREKIRYEIIKGDNAYETFSVIENDMDCLIVAVCREDNELCAITESETQKGYTLIDLFDIYPFLTEPACPEIQKYKDKYKGRRCFIIGNGPSLRAEDLDLLYRNKEITFASNKIYLIFDKTAWRPDYYCVSDYLLFNYNADVIMDLKLPVKIFPSDQTFKRVSDFPADDSEIIRSNAVYVEFGTNLPRFSSDVSFQTFGAWTITYELLQTAAYMGFQEMFLLGVDNTIPKNNEIYKMVHFDKKYFSDNELSYMESNGVYMHTEGVNLAYEKAEQYSRKNGFRIYNATRGGILETFERVDFNGLFGGV